MARGSYAGIRARILGRATFVVILSFLASALPPMPRTAVASADFPIAPAVAPRSSATPGDASLLDKGPITWPVPMRGARATHPFTDPPPEIGAAVGGVIGPAGGAVTSDDDQLSVTFPLGAVPAPVTVSIQRRVVPAWPSVPHAFFWVELGATNARHQPVHHFSVPVQLALHVPADLLALLSVGDLVPAQPEDVRWWQYDDERQEWLAPAR